MFGRRRLEDFSAELRAHVELEADQLRSEGLDEGEARRRAHLSLGNLMMHQERFYEASRWAGLDQLRQDLRYSLRQLRHAPAFTLTAVATLALGIGATTAIFTLIHEVMLKSLPVSHPEQLYTFGDPKRTGVNSGMQVDWSVVSRDLYEHFRDHTEGFEQLAAFQGDPRRVGVRRGGDARPSEPMIAQYVSGNYFSTFGIPAFAGRMIDDGTDRKSAAPVAVMAYRTWEHRYALDRSVLGSTFEINGIPLTIVGIAPPGFFGDALRSNAPEFWIPLAKEPEVNHGGWGDNPELHWLLLMGRVKTGADARMIEAQMTVELRQWLRSRLNNLGPEAEGQLPRQRLHLRPGGSGVAVIRATYSAGLEMLMGISGFVLLIVCANLANLMLVRGLARRKQTSISLALGAARSRLVRQALTESVALALIGGAAGVVLAFAGTRALLSAVFTGSSYVPISAKPDIAVLGFAFVASFVTGLLFGAAPAWAANRADPIDALRSAGRSSEQGGSLPQRSLVIMQAAITVALLAATGLLTDSLRNLEHQRFGFAPDGRMAVRIDPYLAGYRVDQLEALYRRICDRVSRIAGVKAASYALYAPMNGSYWTTDIDINGRPAPAVDGDNLTAWNRVGPNYFETVGTRVIRGRPILESDTANTKHVAVVNEAFVRRFFPNEDPIGKHFGALAKFSNALEIVGIVENAKYREPNQAADPMYFVSRPQMTPYDEPGTLSFETRSMYVNDIVLRVAGRAGNLEEELRRAFAEIDPNLTVIRILSFDAATSNQFGQEQLLVRLTSLFGMTALLLASIGLYGVTSYSVARKSKEIGIRVALGAKRRSIVRMVLQNAYALVGIGLALGIPLAAGMGRIMGSRLYGVYWYSPSIFIGSAVVLAAFALIATIAPARRAARVEPMETLRGE